MKKLMTLLLAVAIVATCGIAAAFAEDPVICLDAFMVNGKGTNYNVRESQTDAVHISINQGDTLKALGWAYKIGANVDRLYWQSFAVDADTKFKDEPERACADNYRSRNDVAEYFGFDQADYQWFTKSGFGRDDSYMELIGVSDLEPGQYYVRLVIVFDDQTTEVVKKKFILEVNEGAPTVQPKVTVNGAAVSPESENGVEISADGDNLVVKTPDTGANDPWVSIPLGGLDTTNLESFTIKYTLEGDIYGNNIYFKDTEKNPAYSGVEGTWLPAADMNGKGEFTFVIPEYMRGTSLTGIRIPGAATPGSSLVIESITFNEAHQQGDDTGNPDTANGSMIIFIVAAAAAALVILKKKAF